MNAPAKPLSGSHIAAVLGMDPYKSALEVWFELTGRRTSGPGSESPDDRRRRRALERHRALEEVCVSYGTEELEALTGRTVERTNLSTVSLPDSPWASSTVPCAWEVGNAEELVLGVPKTVSGAEMFHKRWGAERTDQVADPVLVTAQWHLIHHPEALRCMSPVLIGGWKFNFSWWMVEADAELGQILLDRAHTWYEAHIVKGNTPPATPRDDVLLARLYAGRKDEQMRAELDLVELAVEAKRLGAEGDRFKHQSDKLRTKIRELMKDATLTRWGEGRKVTLSVAKPKPAVNWHGVATDLGAKVAPEVFTAVIAKNTYEKLDKRVLRITIPGYDDDEDDNNG